MGWDERLFGKLFAALRGRRQRAGPAAAVAAPEQLRRHELVASAVAGRRLRVVVAVGDGGLRGDTLVLPLTLATFATLEANQALLGARVVVSAVIAREPPPGPGEGELTVRTLSALVRARAVIATELPGGHARLAELLPALRASRPPPRSPGHADRVLEAAALLALGASIEDVAVGPLVPDRGWLAAMASGAPVDAGPAAGGRIAAVPLVGWLGPPGLDGVEVTAATPAEPQRGGGEQREGRARDRVRRRQLDTSALGENPLIHSFEKVHTLEKYQGGRKRVDGDDDLAAHGDALDELELDEVTRSSTAAGSVYRADVVGVESGGALAGAPASTEALSYDEWDGGAGRYRRGWCAVNVEHAPPRADPGASRRFVRSALGRYRRERNELLTQLARLDGAPTRLTRQADGPEVDVDAIVDRHGSIRHGSTGPEKLYIAHRRRPPDLAVALLLDRSLSSDAWVADQRVLDAGAGALVALGEALDHVTIPTAIVAFSSHTRRDCRLAVIKRFAAPWSEGYARLAALVPSGYTRIGPALRHVTAMLDAEPARRKLLILLSDGKPTDYDRYEGRYGVLDVRKAVQEAGRCGVQVFAVALDRRARHHLPQMFGAGGFAVVSRPRDLVGAIGLLYRQRLVGH